MQVRQVLDYVDEIKPNAFTDEQKLQWLGELEGKIQTLIVGAAPETSKAFTLAADACTTLLAPPPFDRVYGLWLCAMVDFANGEYDKYQNSQTMANDAYGEYARWYMRKHHTHGAQCFRVF